MSKHKLVLLICTVVVLAFGSIFALQAQEFGTNWSGSFYPTTNLTGNAVPVVGINGLNFNWGISPASINSVAVPITNCTAQSPIPTGTSANCADYFSARFTSTQTFNAGTYTFTVSSDDGVRVYVDGQLLLDKFIGRPLTTDTFQTTLTSGIHNLTVEYFEGIDNAILQVQWAFSGVAGPTATFGPSPTPGPTATPAPTGLPSIPSGALSATVIRAPILNVRGAPSVFADRVGRVVRGQTYQVVGRDANARWFLLQLSDRQGWALGYYLSFSSNEFNAPVVSGYVLEGDPASASGIVAMSQATLRLRSEPNVDSTQIGRVTWGGVMSVIGKTRGGDWYQVVWKGTTGWVASGWVEIVEGDVSNVPVVQ